ncbi:Clp protease N-terminal domain-containing protein [Streptomyces asoensis]|uniref:Clp protease N-terminal domain-containing protein n=1 Tax=Streptomyces asoensis TaxID=249586 RepID=UPI0034015E1C
MTLRTVGVSLFGLAPLAAGAWWAFLHLPWPVAAALVAVAWLLPRHHVIGVPAAAAAWLWLDLPDLPFLAAVCCRTLWERPLRLWAASPLRSLGVSPGIRCPHSARDRIAHADRDLRRGRPATALQEYLEILAAHSPGDDCLRPLLGRAAEAALRSGCPVLAAELAAGAAVASTALPLGAEAVRVVRAQTLRAWALDESDDRDSAGGALHAAQSFTQRNRDTDELLRTTAAVIHLRERRLTVDPENEYRSVAEALSGQRIRAGNQRALFALHRAAGHRLARAGSPGKAADAFHRAAEETGVYRHVVFTSLRVLTWWRVRLPVRWRHAVRMWTEAQADEMRQRIDEGYAPASDDRIARRAACHLAEHFDDPLLTARLRIYRDELDRRSPTETDEQPTSGRRHAPERRAAVFADPVAQRAWARLRHETRTWSDTAAGQDEAAWWEGWHTPQEARTHTQVAQRLFERLRVVEPTVFAPALVRVRNSLLTHPRHGPVPGSRIGPAEPALVPAVHPATSDHRDLGVAHSPSARTPLRPPGGVAGTRAPIPAAASGPGAEPPTARPTGGPTLPDAAEAVRRDPTELAPPRLVAPRLLVEPPGWLTRVDRLTGGRCWPVLSAMAEAHALGHGQVTPGHLLLVLLDEPGCALLTEPCGFDAGRLRRALRAQYGADGGPGARKVPEPDRDLRAALSRARAAAAHAGETGLAAERLLETLTASRRGGLAALLGTGGADLDEACFRVRHRHSPTASLCPVPEIRWSGPGFPLELLTPDARSAVARAARHAAATTGLLGPEGILAQVDPSASVASGDPGETAADRVLRCRATPAAVRLLLTARQAARVQGHPGVDIEHLVRQSPTGLPAASSVHALTSSAQAHAQGAGAAWIGPEHLAAALAGSTDPADTLRGPLPLTPLAARTLATAARSAAAEGRTTWEATDVGRALPLLWRPVSPRPAWEDRAAHGPLTSLAEAHQWDQAIAAEAHRARRALAASNPAAARTAHATWMWMLRFLVRVDRVAVEPRLADELITAAGYHGPCPAAPRALEEAAVRARVVAARVPGEPARLAGSLARIGALHREFGSDATAADCYDDAARLLRSPAPLWLNDPVLDGLLAQVLLHRARILVTQDPAVAPAALVEAASHRLTAAAESDAGPSRRTATVRASLTVMRHLDALGEGPAAVDIATRTLRLFGPAERERALVPVHHERAALLWQLGRGDLGEADLAAAVELDHDSVFALLAHGGFLLRVRRFDEALDVFTRARDLRPDDAQVSARQAEAMVAQGLYAQALPLLREADTPLLLLSRARALRGLGLLSEAAADTRAASAAEPDTAWYRYQHGLSLLTTGEEQHGRRQIGLALRLERGDLGTSERWYGLGAGKVAVYCAALGGPRQARAWYNRALPAMRYPWEPDELCSDLRELAALRPELSEFVKELTWAKG